MLSPFWNLLHRTLVNLKPHWPQAGPLRLGPLGEESWSPLPLGL